MKDEKIRAVQIPHCDGVLSVINYPNGMTDTLNVEYFNKGLHANTKFSLYIVRGKVFANVSISEGRGGDVAIPLEVFKRIVSEGEDMVSDYNRKAEKPFFK